VHDVDILRPEFPRDTLGNRAEEARRLVDPALKLMMDAVHHYGGYVAQSTGDGIFALFGAPAIEPALLLSLVG
jgi:class 3 adenylate cyclase